MQNRLVQCTILPPIQILASPAPKHAARTAGELSDSAQQENAALRIRTGQYNLNYGR